MLPPPSSATTLPTPAPETSAPTKRRTSLGWIVGCVVALGAFWGATEWLRSSDAREAEVKAWLATVAVGLALVQIVTMAVVYRGRASRPTTRALARVHRISGRVAVTTAAFVAYLCITSPFPEGFTWHRLFGFGLAAVVLVKIVIVRGIPRAGAALPVLGLGVAALLVAPWVTKAMDVL